MTRRNLLALFAAALSAALFINVAAAKDDAKKEDKDKEQTISGKSSCATCDGITADDHEIMLVDEDGERWVLKGEGDDYKKAHKVRKDGKTMTAKYKGDAETKKDDDGKEYKVVTITEIKVEDKA